MEVCRKDPPKQDTHEQTKTFLISPAHCMDSLFLLKIWKEYHSRVQQAFDLISVKKFMKSITPFLYIYMYIYNLCVCVCITLYRQFHIIWNMIFCWLVYTMYLRETIVRYLKKVKLELFDSTNDVRFLFFIFSFDLMVFLKVQRFH